MKLLRLAVVAVLLTIGVQPAHALAQIEISNDTNYFVNLDYKVLEDYLAGVEEEWGWAYHGRYRIYITNHLPTSIATSATAAGEHQAGGAIYVGAAEVLTSGYSIYYVITHELAETAIDENLDFYNKGQLVEIADPVINQVSHLDGQIVASYVLPSYYGWPQF